MEIAITEQGGTQVVSLEGEVDLQTSPQLREALLKCVENGKPIAVEMASVSYIDSSGVASLVEAFQAARTKGLNFCLAAINEAPLRVLKLARLDGVFIIHENLEQALSSNK